MIARVDGVGLGEGAVVHPDDHVARVVALVVDGERAALLVQYDERNVIVEIRGNDADE